MLYIKDLIIWFFLAPQPKHSKDEQAWDETSSTKKTIT